MKTPEQWQKELPPIKDARSFEDGHIVGVWHIKAIQTDAFKAGMLYAANMVVVDGNPDIAKALIESTAQSMKEIPEV